MSYTQATALAEETSDRQPNHRDRPVPAPSDETQQGLIEFYLPIVKSAVARIKPNLPPHIEADDLYSVGLTGLVKAIRHYDPAQKRSFGCYAATRVRGAILDELRRIDWMPRNARAQSKRLRRTVDDLEQRLGRVAAAEEVQRELNLTPREYQALLDQVRPVSLVPLDSTSAADDADAEQLSEVIADDCASSVTDKLEREEMITQVAARINELPEVPRKVIAMYYYENMRLAEIAAVFGLTESRIYQIHAQAILALRTNLAQTMNN